MVIIVDSHTVWHFQGTEIQVHICVSNRDALEGFDSGFEGVNWNADLSFSVLIPIFFQKFSVLASPFLNLDIRMCFKAPDHLVDSFFIGKFLIELQQA